MKVSDSATRLPASERCTARVSFTSPCAPPTLAEPAHLRRIPLISPPPRVLAVAGALALASAATLIPTTLLSSANAATLGCSVAYSTQSQWAGGFVANLVISNTGASAINGWTLTFTFPGDQKVTNAWSATVTQSGE